MDIGGCSWLYDDDTGIAPWPGMERRKRRRMRIAAVVLVVRFIIWGRAGVR